VLLADGAAVWYVWLTAGTPECLLCLAVRGPLRYNSRLRVKRGMFTDREQIGFLTTNTGLNFFKDPPCTAQ